MTPAQTDALIKLVTNYQQADSAFEADASTPNAVALATSLAELLDWRVPAPQIPLPAESPCWTPEETP